MAGRAMELQPMVTTSGASGADSTMPRDQWVDAGSFDFGAFYVQIPSLTTGATFQLQSAVVPEESAFQDISGTEFTSATSATVVVKKNAANPVLRYLRWKIDAPGAAWSATFRVTAVLKNT